MFADTSLKIAKMKDHKNIDDLNINNLIERCAF